MTQTYYRYEDQRVSTGYDELRDCSSGSYCEVRCYEYHLVKKTPKGAWISQWRENDLKPIQGVHRFVLDHGTKRFAHETKEAALASFIARKKAQIGIHEAHARSAREALECGERIARGEKQERVMW